MLIDKRSVITGALNQMDLDVTLTELKRHEDGELAQRVWPHLTSPEREFLISGITVEEWADAMGCEGCEE